MTRRPFRGPLCPTWSWSYELLVESIRLQLAGDTTLEERRARFDAMGRREDARGRVDLEPIDSDICGDWIRPRSGFGKRVVLYLHGGGYTSGSNRSHRGIAASLAIASRARAFALAYRRAPEHPCPAAIDDAVAAFRWLCRGGIPPGDIVMAGDSAGGGLALAALVALREMGQELPAGAVLISPLIDLRPQSLAHPTRADYLSARELAEHGRWYAGELPLADPRVSPGLANLRGLPPLLVIAGGQERLAPQIRRMVSGAREAGCQVTLIEEPDEIHAFPLLFELNSRARAVIERAGDFVVRGTTRRSVLRNKD